MSDDLFTIDQKAIRGTDTNSLLRLYDRAGAILRLSSFQQQRMRAEKVLERITNELQKRNVVVKVGPAATDPVARLDSVPVAAG